jgi:hypothetical protein
MFQAKNAYSNTPPYTSPLFIVISIREVGGLALILGDSKVRLGYAVVGADLLTVLILNLG